VRCSPRLSLAAGIAALAATTGGREARACAVCGAGDPTLTVMGDEKPFQGRARAAVELRMGEVRVGQPGVSEIGMSEARVELAAAYAPVRPLLLMIAVPLLFRRATFPDGGRSRVATIGDVELRAKVFVYGARRGPHKHEVAIQGGIKAPSGPVQDDDRGAPLPATLQPGMGAVTPFAGLFYGMVRGPWSFYASLTSYLPFPVRDTAHASDSLRSSASVQRQVGRRFAARIGLDTRLEGTSETNGRADPNSGGFVAYLSSGLVVSPVEDLLLGAGVHAPFGQAFRGYHHESAIGVVSVYYDF
jgi:hypothetical protein